MHGGRVVRSPCIRFGDTGLPTVAELTHNVPNPLIPTAA